MNGVTTEDLETALEVLLLVSTDDGTTSRERDDIAQVRTVLWDIADGKR
jgi:hypothetical protein